MVTEARSEELADGRHRRHVVPRSDHAGWEPLPNRPDPVAIIEAQNKSRLPALVPVRIGRMIESPFAFLRGAALVMAHDLATTPDAGFTVQICGDAHMANFGLFASPERVLLFDVNDFDETDAGPWEWDVKRLCASAAVVARDAGRPPSDQQGAARAAAAAYRTHMAEYATMSELDLWYARVDAETAGRLIASADAAAKPAVQAELRAARHRTSASALPKLTELAPNGSPRIVDHPPLVSHEGVDKHGKLLEEVRSGYLAALDDARRALVGRFEAVDFALKVVGVGSVGTRCFIALLLDETEQPLLLQVKEADESAPAQAGAAVPRPGRRRGPGTQARRVVEGQHRMQAATDLFLGWSDAEGVDYYVRQLRDMKGSVDASALDKLVLVDYAGLCGWVLARAHARSAGAATAARIAGYLGSSDAFEDALANFALAYADQTERDHEALVAAVHAGRLPAETGT
ncbi:MAG TPA: DUF2252 domain-containing protein [Acidimicrobiales bacterium]|nr:DUF2252 domain-containing protein [Acidimicrobiales bacterium]